MPPSSSFLKAEQSNTEDDGEEGRLYYDLEEALFSFSIEIEDTVVSEEKRVWYHGRLVWH